MYTVPEWVTVGLLALYYGSLFSFVRFFNKIRDKLGKYFMPLTAVYILLEGGVFLTALVTSKRIEYVFGLASLMMLAAVPFLLLSLTKLLAQEARE